MNLHMVGCTHRNSNVDVRQRLAFGDEQASCALRQWRQKLPEAEMVLLSTCNRVELYAGWEQADVGTPIQRSDELKNLLLSFHQVPPEQVQSQIITLAGPEVVDHLYRVTASLDSMVIGEPQVLAQVREAYQRAQRCVSTGPILNNLFQSALRSARCVAGKTELHKHRVSIPSVAVADFASRVFERFDDKHVLVIGAGEMADETLRYLQDAGATKIHVINRDAKRGKELATRWSGTHWPWQALWDQLVAADLVISTTAAAEPIVTADTFASKVAPRRHQRLLFILDLAVPRDFDARVGESLGVYLYSLDDLAQACERNRHAREKELPVAEKILTQEMERFFADSHHRATVPVIAGLRRGFEVPKETELKRLFHKLPDLDEQTREEISLFADRLVNKMLHPPMQSLRKASQNGTPHSLLDALRHLFQLKD